MNIDKDVMAAQMLDQITSGLETLVEAQSEIMKEILASVKQYEQFLKDMQDEYKR